MKVAVLGAGGFVGGHLVRALLDEGHEVRSVDRKQALDWHQRHETATNRIIDCSNLMDARQAVMDCEQVYLLAANMGGIGFIEQNKLDCALNVQITASVLEASVQMGVRRLFYSSSACIYPAYLQTDKSDSLVLPLREDMAYPADPEDGYGWEKLYGERLCRHFDEETALSCRVARYHNIYGPHGTWDGGREKAPAALCRKVAMVDAGLTNSVSIWGDGSQYRSYCYVDDCVKGTMALMASDWGPDPINIGSSEGVSVNQLLHVIQTEAGIEHLEVHREPDAPQGVAGRNSDNTLCKRVLGWEPTMSLKSGIHQLYPWVYWQVVESAGLTEGPSSG